MSLEQYHEVHRRFQDAFESAVKLFSEGEYEGELLRAKDQFFSKLGKSHELRGDIFEGVSETFLEWYLFNYQISFAGAAPATLAVTLDRLVPEHVETLHLATFHLWSLFEVKEIKSDYLTLTDLLTKKSYRVFYHEEVSALRLARLNKGQIIQTRLYPMDLKKSQWWLRQLWCHGHREFDVIRTVCQERKPKGIAHDDFLLAAFEAHIRSLGIQDQLLVAKAENWHYHDLWKKYA